MDSRYAQSRKSSKSSWHGEGEWEARILTGAGTLVAMCDRFIEFLLLHYGTRRFDLEEALHSSEEV